jgi:antitoxin component YwqK of YwqJK toxin-antitoxin module
MCMILISCQSNAQNEHFFSVKGNEVTFYLTCNGSLTINKKAEYERVVTFEQGTLVVSSIRDYYKGGLLALTAFYKKGLLDGLLTSYYANGKIKEQGKYVTNNRDSIWCYYSSKGQLEKKIDFRNGQTKLIEYYGKNGESKLINGSGSYKGFTNKDYASCDKLAIKGEIKDGLMEGRWSINFKYSTATESFENGKFIQGYESNYNRSYNDVSLISITGFPYYENCSFINYTSWLDKIGLSEYSNLRTPIFRDKFLAPLKEAIQDSLVKDDKSFFFTLLEFRVMEEKIMASSFQAFTSSSSVSKKIQDIILSLDKWQTKEDKDTYVIYMPIFWENGIVYLRPEDLR